MVCHAFRSLYIGPSHSEFSRGSAEHAENVARVPQKKADEAPSHRSLPAPADQETHPLAVTAAIQRATDLCRKGIAPCTVPTYHLKPGTFRFSNMAGRGREGHEDIASRPGYDSTRSTVLAYPVRTLILIP